jgi:hypothetical protein
MKLTELADIIRSKNSGPYELTLDVMFKTDEDFKRVWESGAISEKTICELYRITPDKIVSIVPFPPAKAIKATIVRPICSGDPGETDVYGAQQHAPLLNLEVNI